MKFTKKINLKIVFSFFLPEKYYSNLTRKLKGIFKELKTFKTLKNNFSEIKENSKIVLLASIGKITKKEINEVCNRLNIQGKKIFGLIIIES